MRYEGFGTVLCWKHWRNLPRKRMREIESEKSVQKMCRKSAQRKYIPNYTHAQLHAWVANLIALRDPEIAYQYVQQFYSIGVPSSERQFYMLFLLKFCMRLFAEVLTQLAN